MPKVLADRPGQHSQRCAPAADQKRVQGIVRSPAAAEGWAVQKLLQPLHGARAGQKAEGLPSRTTLHPWHQRACIANLTVT